MSKQGQWLNLKRLLFVCFFDKAHTWYKLIIIDAAKHTSLSSITKNIFKSQGAKGFFVGK